MSRDELVLAWCGAMLSVPVDAARWIGRMCAAHGLVIYDQGAELWP